MYEELIQRLENAAGGPEGIKMAHDAADAIAALQAENAELQRDAEHEHERYIETLGERDGFEARATVLGAALARVEAGRDAAVRTLGLICEHCGFIIGSKECEDCGCPIHEWRGAQGEG